jgi:hypothetical protein
LYSLCKRKQRHFGKDNNGTRESVIKTMVNNVLVAQYNEQSFIVTLGDESPVTEEEVAASSSVFFSHELYGWKQAFFAVIKISVEDGANGADSPPRNSLLLGMTLVNCGLLKPFIASKE